MNFDMKERAAGESVNTFQWCLKYKQWQSLLLFLGDYVRLISERKCPIGFRPLSSVSTYLHNHLIFCLNGPCSELYFPLYRSCKIHLDGC